MTDDSLVECKNQQRVNWARVGAFAMFTAAPAAHLVRFAGIRSGQAVIDVATGTGVVAITARLSGARVTALDLTPELLAQAKANAAIAEIRDIAWHEGDVEALP